MKIAFLIMAYKNPKQMGRLILSLNSTDSAFYLHIDKKSNLPDFKNVLSQLNKNTNITFLPRFDCYWRGPGIITSILYGLNKILEDKNFNRIVLISGQDYPIKPVEHIFNFYENNSEKNFISYFKLPYDNWLNGGLARIKNYHFRIFGKTYIYPPLADPVHAYSKLFYKTAQIRFRKPREFPDGLVPYGGFSHWQITALAAREILDFVNKRPDYLKFHKYSWVADEMFFQTVLLNSKNDALINSIVNNDLTYIKWLKDMPQTEILKTCDYEEIKNSNKLFARKFDTSIDSQILSLLDINNRFIDPISLQSDYSLSLD
jgi:hypothetical protein